MITQRISKARFKAKCHRFDIQKNLMTVLNIFKEKGIRYVCVYYPILSIEI